MRDGDCSTEKDEAVRTFSGKGEGSGATGKGNASLAGTTEYGNRRAGTDVRGKRRGRTDTRQEAEGQEEFHKYGKT